MNCHNSPKRSPKSLVSSPSSRESASNSARKRKLNEEEAATTHTKSRLSPSKQSKLVPSRLIPKYLISIVEEKSFVKTFTLMESTDFSTLEEIEKPDKFFLRFELFKIETYLEQDITVLRVRDGTICPASLLCLPKATNWEALEQSIVEDPEYRSNEPIVDILLFNSSFADLFKLKEFFCYTMQNVMVVKTIGNKGLLLCANGKDAYLNKLKVPSEHANQILSKTAHKNYHKLEEKYLQSLISSPVKKPIARKEDITSDTKVEEDDDKEEYMQEKREKSKVGKFQTNKVNSKATEIGSNKDENKVRRPNRSNKSVDSKKSTTTTRKEERTPLRKLRSTDETNIKSSPNSDKLKKRILSKTEEYKIKSKTIHEIDRKTSSPKTNNRKTSPTNLNKKILSETEDEDSDEEDEDTKEDKIKTKTINEIEKYSSTPKTKTKQNSTTNLKKKILSGTEDEEDKIRNSTSKKLKVKENENKEEIQNRRKKLEVGKFKTNKVSPKVKETDSIINENKLRRINNRSSESVVNRKITTPTKKGENLPLRKLKSKEEENTKSSPNSDKSNKKLLSETEDDESDKEDKIKSKTKTINKIDKNTSTTKTNRNSTRNLKKKIHSEGEESDEETDKEDTSKNKTISKIDKNSSTNEKRLRSFNTSIESVDSKTSTTPTKKGKEIPLRKLRSKEKDIKSSLNSDKLNKKIVSETDDEDSDEETDKEDKIKSKTKTINKINRNSSTPKTKRYSTRNLKKKIHSEDEDSDEDYDEEDEGSDEETDKEATSKNKTISKTDKNSSTNEKRLRSFNTSIESVDSKKSTTPTKKDKEIPLRKLRSKEEDIKSSLNSDKLNKKIVSETEDEDSDKETDKDKIKTKTINKINRNSSTPKTKRNSTRNLKKKIHSEDEESDEDYDDEDEDSDEEDTSKNKTISKIDKNSSTNEKRLRSFNTSIESVDSKKSTTPTKKDKEIPLRKLRSKEEDIKSSRNNDKLNKKIVSETEDEDSDEETDKEDKIKSKTKTINKINRNSSTPKTKRYLTRNLKKKIHSEDEESDEDYDEEDDDSDEETDKKDTSKNKTISKIDKNSSTNEKRLRIFNTSIESVDSKKSTTPTKKGKEIPLRKLRSKEEDIKSSLNSYKLNKKILSETEDEGSDEEDENTDKEDKIKYKTKTINKIDKNTSSPKTNRNSTRNLKKKIHSEDEEEDEETDKEDTSKNKIISKIDKNSSTNEKRLRSLNTSIESVDSKKSTTPTKKGKEIPLRQLRSKEEENKKSSPKSDKLNKKILSETEDEDSDEEDVDNTDEEDKIKCDTNKEKNSSKNIKHSGNNKKRNLLEKKERTTPKILRKDENESETRTRESKDVKKSGLEEEKREAQKYKTISELKGEHINVNTAGVIKNILKEDSKVYKWRIAVEIVDETQEDPSFKVHLFLPQIALIALDKVMEKNQIIELIGMKVGKFNGVIGGGVYVASSVELYDLDTGKNIEWRELPSGAIERSASSDKIIQGLHNWSTKEKDGNQDLRNSKDKSLDKDDSLSQPGPSLTEHIFKRPKARNSSSKEKEKIVEEKTQSTVSSVNKSKYYNILKGITTKSSVDEVMTEVIRKYAYTFFNEITEAGKVNLLVQIVNVHFYSELNLVVLQVKDETLCPLPMLHIPLEYVWSNAKETIINDPLYTSNSPIVDILCFESKPYLPPLQIGKSYRFHSVLVIKREKPGSNSKQDEYLMCVESKDCEVQNCSKRKSLSTPNEKVIFTSEAPFVHSVSQKNKNVVYYPEWLRQSAEKIIKLDLMENKSSVLPSSEDSVDRAMCNLPIPDPQQDDKKVERNNSGKKTVPDSDASTPSLIDLAHSDEIVTNVPSSIAKEIDSIMQEESMLGLPVIISENTHLRNSGSDPTYSQFAQHVDKRSKGFKTSTQDVGLNNIACTLSSGYGQCIDSLELMNNTVLSKDNSAYSPDSLESVKQISNNVPSTPNNSIQVDDDNVEDDSLSKAGSESILTHRFIDRIKQITLVDQITEKKQNNAKENEKTSWDEDELSSDIEVIKENIMPKKSNLNLLSRKSSSTKSTPEHPKLLAQALYEGKIRLPSYCCYKSEDYNYDSSEEEIQSEKVDCNTSSDVANTSSDAAITTSDADIVSVVDRPDLPIASIATFLEIKNTNCHDYTVIPLKLSPELEGDWAEKVVRCVCSKCEKTYVLSDLEKISTVDNDDWPDHKVPVCPNDKCNKQCIEADSAHFYFEMELNAIKVKLTCTAILSSNSAETFLDCSTLEFLNNIEKRNQVKSRLSHLFLENNKDKNEYIFKLFRKNMFDPDSGPLYIRNIRIK